MGTKDSKLTPDAAESVAAFTDRIRPLGDITTEKMFGGYGVFESAKMFALVNSDCQLFLKAAGDEREKFEAAGSDQHGRMPYFRIPDPVLTDDHQLLEWTGAAIQKSKE